MKAKRKDLLKIIIINVIAIGTLAFIGTRLYVKKNYDIKVVTSYSVGFYSIAARHDTFYLVNSSLGVKTKTTKFSVKPNKLDIEQLQRLIELSEIDYKFLISQNTQTIDYVFFYENCIFYMRFYGEHGLELSAEDMIDRQENIYKYNIDTKEIQQIKITQYEDKDVLGHKSDFVNVKFEALKYLYPKLKEAISSKCDNNNHLGVVFYDNGRIFFTTNVEGSSLGENNHLYEYLPTKNKTKKIASTSASISSVDVVK